MSAMEIAQKGEKLAGSRPALEDSAEPAAIELDDFVKLGVPLEQGGAVRPKEPTDTGLRVAPTQAMENRQTTDNIA